MPLRAGPPLVQNALIRQRSAPVSVLVSFPSVLDRLQPFAHGGCERDGRDDAPGGRASDDLLGGLLIGTVECAPTDLRPPRRNIIFVTANEERVAALRRTAEIGEGGVPRMFVMVGLPSAGNTSRARELAATWDALRLTPDE